MHLTRNYSKNTRNARRNEAFPAQKYRGTLKSKQKIVNKPKSEEGLGLFSARQEAEETRTLEVSEAKIISRGGQSDRLSGTRLSQCSLYHAASLASLSLLSISLIRRLLQLGVKRRGKKEEGGGS